MHPTVSPGIERAVQWEDRTAWPLFIGSVLMFGCVTMTWIDQHPSDTGRLIAGLLIVVLWAWFLVDYFARLALAKGARRYFFRSRILDLASLALPFLRPFLLIVYIWRLPVFRRGTASMQRLRYAVATVLFAFLFVYVSSYLVWAAERSDPRANIVNFEDAVWWGFSTIATVGYGDFVPVTGLGRVLAVGLMIGGIVVVGIITATLISSLTDRIRAIGAAERERVQAEQARESAVPEAIEQDRGRERARDTDTR